MIRITDDELRKTAREVLADLPEEFRSRLENVSIVIGSRPTPRDLEKVGVRGRATLLGLYRGVPRTVRGENYSLAPPDEIVLFGVPIRSIARSRGDVRDLVRKVLLHELGHYFGIGDAELRRLGY